MTAAPPSARSRSLWLDQVGELTPRPALEGDLDVDIAIVGGGLTGLWAAYYAATTMPDARIVLLEKEIVGYGAAGRNGGWAGAGLAGKADLYAKKAGWDEALRAARLTETAIDEIGEVVDREGIPAEFVKGGTLAIAFNAPQWQRLRQGQRSAEDCGLAEPDSRLLDADEVRALVAAPSIVGGVFRPHCARIHPARLIRGLAEVCERRGVRIHEKTPVRRIEAGRVHTDRGVVRARTVLRATEAWTSQVTRGASYLPLTSMMIATEPLPSRVWEEIGWPQGLTVRDSRHLFFYAQRTADDRIAIGGRGAPYRLREPLSEFGERDRPVWDRLASTLHEHFPATRDAEITHRWGGTLAVPRDWTMSVQYDRASGTGWAGGYGGHGVIAAHLAARTLVDLVAERRTEHSTAPWVGHRSRRWEPEPLRYLAASAIVRVLNGADVREDATGRPSRRVRLLKPVLPPG